jgi:hypothetical protein
MDIFTTPGNQEGACLIELLLVFVIVGILISIGFPVYSVIIRRIEGVVCSTHNSHLNTMTHLDSRVTPEKALRDYLNQNGRYLCPSGGFYMYYGSRVGCSKHNEIEAHSICAYNRQFLKEDYQHYLESVPEHHPTMTWTEFLEDHQNLCPSSGVISYSSGTVVRNLHHSSHGGGDDDEDDGSVPYL